MASNLAIATILVLYFLAHLTFIEANCPPPTPTPTPPTPKPKPTPPPYVPPTPKPTPPTPKPTPPTTKPPPCVPPTPKPTPPTPKPTPPTTKPPPPLVPATPTPPATSTPPPSPSQKCPKDTLKLGACADLLGLVNVIIGTPPSSNCCALISGLADLDAALCLCTAIKANVIGINLNVPVTLSLILSACQKNVPSGFQCP